jgi:hydrogenase maturation protease
MGDEGVGVHIVRHLQDLDLPDGVECLDGGTGSFQLLGPLREADRVILVDATVDGATPGTVTRLTPRFSQDYPPTLTAHDIGLKDLLDAFYLLGEPPDVTLYAVSIEPPEQTSLEMSDKVTAKVSEIAEQILRELPGS